VLPLEIREGKKLPDSRQYIIRVTVRNVTIRLPF
jgi:hypothetical protein